MLSALPKCIRRGEVDDALHWAVELDRLGFGAWCWKRLRIITSEDVGPAWLEGPAVVQALYRTYTDLNKATDDRQQPWRLMLVQPCTCWPSRPRAASWIGR